MRRRRRPHRSISFRYTDGHSRTCRARYIQRTCTLLVSARWSGQLPLFDAEVPYNADRHTGRYDSSS